MVHLLHRAFVLENIIPQSQKMSEYRNFKDYHIKQLHNPFICGILLKYILTFLISYIKSNLVKKLPDQISTPASVITSVNIGRTLNPL